jgi:lipopolysaccharide biosynthesis glycosyltransferase
MIGYISYVCSDNFIPGVVALYNSVRNAGCENDFLVLVTDDVTEEARQILAERNLQIVNVEKVFYNGKRKDKIIDRYGKTDESWKMFTKLNIWKQTKYEKLIYLDADTIVLENIDELFDIDQLGAVLGGSQGLNYIGIEAGVLVINPNLDTYNKLVEALESDVYNIKMSDQSFLNDYFTRIESINYIPEVYNRLYKKNSNPTGAKVFHFNSSKPWINPETLIKPCVNLWNHFYEKNYD